MEVSVRFRWDLAGSIQIDSAMKPVFPALQHVPGLYVFRLVGVRDNKTDLYVGEAADLHRRMNNYYRHGHQRGNVQMRKLLAKHTREAGRIELSISTSVEARFDQEWETLDLSRKTARLLAESAAVLEAGRRSDVRVLNVQYAAGVESEIDSV